MRCTSTAHVEFLSDSQQCIAAFQGEDNSQMTEQDTMKITFQCKGLTGVDDDPKNPVSRALTSLMHDNTLLPSYSQVFVVDDTAGQSPRWLGVFDYSAGDRVIYFPGFKPDLIRVRGVLGRGVKFDRPFNLDHVSLEKHRDKWHITTQRSTDHQGGPACADLGAGRVLWFGLSLASLEVLREVKQETVATFSVSERGATWKAQQFQAACRGTGELRMPPRPNSGTGFFPHIAFIIGPKNFPIYGGPDWGWPYGSEFAKGGPKEGEPMPAKISVSQFSLTDELDLQLAATWAPGELAIPVVMTAPQLPAPPPPEKSLD